MGGRHGAAALLGLPARGSALQGQAAVQPAETLTPQPTLAGPGEATAREARRSASCRWRREHNHAGPDLTDCAHAGWPAAAGGHPRWRLQPCMAGRKWGGSKGGCGWGAASTARHAARGRCQFEARHCELRALTRLLWFQVRAHSCWAVVLDLRRHQVHRCRRRRSCVQCARSHGWQSGDERSVAQGFV